VRETLYLETSVVSYYTARPGRTVVGRARQLHTRRFWSRLPEFQVFVSEAVVQEALLGDRSAAAARQRALEGIPLLGIPAAVESLAQDLMAELVIPRTALRDAVHLAVAIHHGIDYLVTWNCAHLANPRVMRRLIASRHGRRARVPVICTPEEFLEV
jgi:predicted nucleic acid-binding protein